MKDDLPHEPTAEGLRLLPTACCSCGRRIDTGAHSDPTKVQPEPGDVAVCMYCGGFNVFNADQSLRLMTVEEVGKLDDDTRIHMLRLRRMIHSLDELDAPSG